MNEHKFAFIICTNNETYLSECLHYLEHLLIPETYETEILTIREAVCMTAGYNEGMAATDAKYKIYMHQDVFITNSRFLFDILSIFQSDSSIGMIGIIGYPIISPTGFMWHGKRIGAIPLYGSSEHAYPQIDYHTYQYSFSEDGISDVALIDGLMMVTQRDLPWDEETLKDWDFYDAFQSMNFLLHGYRVVVPIQKLPWCIHDDGKYLSMWNYNKYRKIFMEKYAGYLNKSCEQIRNGECADEHTAL